VCFVGLWSLLAGWYDALLCMKDCGRKKLLKLLKLLKSSLE
jgi:hypothetical protein